MTTPMTRRGAIILAAAAAGAVAVPGTALAAHTGARSGHRDDCTHAEQMVQMAAMLRQLRAARFEQTFMAGMIPHHQAAISMATMQLQRGSHAELKGMARQIISSQSAEIATMTGWLRTWYGVTPEQAMASAPAQARDQMAAMQQHMQMGMAELAAVPAGAAFDEAFMQQMIPHHLAAVIEARTVPGRVTHHALVDLAGTIISSQSHEIVQMTAWLRAWFHTTPCVGR